MADELASTLAMPESPARTAALAAWVQGLFVDSPAVLVGGSAVELYTSGAYVSGDLDFVGVVPAEVAARLRRAGFRKTGRHWVHERGRVFLEFPASRLEPTQQVVDLSVGSAVVRTLAPEGVIVNCLAAWQHWRSAQDGVNALLVARSARIDRKALRELAEKESVTAGLLALERALRRWRGREPEPEELVAWASDVPSA